MPFDHELKLSRPWKHLEDLQGVTTAWLADYNCTVRQEYDPDATPPAQLDPQARSSMLGSPVYMPIFPGPLPYIPFGQGMVAAYVDEIPDKKLPDGLLGVLIGDCLHNLRSALDTLAYSFMLAGPLSVTKVMESNSEFPIFGNEDLRGRPVDGERAFRSARGKRKYVGWKPGAQARVEGLQPYKRGSQFRDDPLWLLHDLERINKHRHLHTTVTYAVGAGWQPTKTKNLRGFGPGFLQSYGGSIEPGAPILKIFGVHLVDPSREVHVEVHPTIDVVFSPTTSGVGEYPIVHTLATLYSHVADQVIAPLTQYL